MVITQKKSLYTKYGKILREEMQTLFAVGLSGVTEFPDGRKEKKKGVAGHLFFVVRVRHD